MEPDGKNAAGPLEDRNWVMGTGTIESLGRNVSISPLFFFV